MPKPVGNMIWIDATMWGKMNAWDAWERFKTFYPDLEVNEFIRKYEDRVLLLLQQIAKTRSGNALLNANRKSITIRPMNDPTQVNAYTTNEAVSSTRKGSLVIACDGMGTVLAQRSGTGTGSSSTIEYSPETFTPGDPLYHQNRQNGKHAMGSHGLSPDEILFHELVHAIAASHGTLNCTPMVDGFDNMDDFRAILFTNIYSSETGRKLRKNHHGHSELVTDKFMPSNFYETYKVQIKTCCQELAMLSQQLALVNCSYNPVREYYRYTQLVAGPVLYETDKKRTRTIVGAPFELPVGP